MSGARRIAIAFLAIGLAVASQRAGAATDPFVDGGDLQRFHPAQTPYGGVAAGSADGMVPGAWSARLHLNYSRNPLVLLRNGQRLDGTVANNLTTHLTAAYGVNSWFDLGVALPLVVFQNGGDDRLAPISALAPGDLRLLPRLLILRQWKDGLSLAFTPILTIPLGGAASFTGDSFLSFAPELTGSYRGHRWYAVGSAQLRLRKEVQITTGYTVGSEVLLKAGFGHEVAKDLEMILEGNGGLALATLQSALQQPLELGAGLRWHLDPQWSIEGHAGLGILSAPGIPDFRFVVGGTYATLPPVPPTNACLAHDNAGAAERRLASDLDTDGDGIDDACDLCPAEPESKNGIQDEDGCNDADFDGDGLQDKVDECPTKAGIAPTGCPDTDEDGLLDRLDQCPGDKGDAPSGCPDTDKDGVLDRDDQCVSAAGVKPTGCPDTDTDGVLDRDDLCPANAGPEPTGCPDSDMDGVFDNRDRCPNDPEDSDGFEDLDGCPEPDNDGDGVLDATDLCPAAKEDVDAFSDDDGCPDPDNDEDGVLDGADKCPNEKETINGVDDTDGCPDKGKSLVVIRLDKIEILDKVYFATNKDIIEKRSFGLLQQVAKVIIANARVGRIRVEGHTDNVGKPAANLDLSRRRAASVVRFLVKEGVEAERLLSEGYGDTRPIKPNLTEKNRAENRRVEFVIIGTDGAPTTEIKSSESRTIELKPIEPMPAAVTPAEVKPAEVKPADLKPAEVKPADVKPADVKPAEVKPADVKPADVKPAEVKPADVKPAEVKPDEPELPPLDLLDLPPLDALPPAPADPAGGGQP